MKKVNLLSKAEMKNVMGGIMDKETTLQYCIDHIPFDDDPIVNELNQLIGTEACYRAYNETP